MVVIMNGRLKASFTIEITYILFIMFCGIAFIIGHAIDRHSAVVNNTELHLLSECIAHDEKNIGYDKEGLKLRISRNIKGGKNISLQENNLFVKGSMEDKSIKISVFNPEAYLRATTALEGIYERYKGEPSEESEE